MDSMIVSWFSRTNILVLITIIIIIIMFGSTHVRCQLSSDSFAVTDSGAISDGKTDNKQAFMNAWKKACESNGGGRVVIPQGTYLLSDAEFVGPCKGQTQFIVNGLVKAPSDPTPNLDYWIMFYNLDGFSLYGNGTFDGNGFSYWKSKTHATTITSIKLEAVRNARIQDINSVNSKMFHIGINNCQHLTMNNVDITAPYNSPNTDGIHIGLSNAINITNSNIGTGDDCISLGDGCKDINIIGIHCGPGHGISIGSLGRYNGEKDVDLINVKNCTFTSTTNGLRIKTIAPSPSSAAYAITFQHIIINNVNNPIIIDQNYCPHFICNPQESDVSIQQVKFIDVRGTSNSVVGVKILCSKKKPCRDIEFSGVKLYYKGQPTTASCSNADVKFFGTGQFPSQCS